MQPISLNLRANIIDQFWETRDPRMRQILDQMATGEYWQMDSRERVAEALAALTGKLDRAEPEVIERCLPHLVRLMAYLSAPRAMRLLEWMSERHDTLAVAITREAAVMDDPCGRLMVERVQTIKSLSLLSNIFAPERVKQITELLRKINNPEMEQIF
jgi:hypothetical protein